MLEFIGFLTICYLGFIAIRALVRKNSEFRSIKFGVEARYFAIEELKVDPKYFNYITQSKIDYVKKIAIHLRDEYSPETPWGALLAAAIYMCFHKDIRDHSSIIRTLAVDSEFVNVEMNVDANVVVMTFLKAKTRYAYMSIDQLNAYLVLMSTLGNKEISHHHSLEPQLTKYVNTAEYMAWVSWGGGEVGFETAVKDDPDMLIYASFKYTNPEDDLAPILLTARAYLRTE